MRKETTKCLKNRFLMQSKVSRHTFNKKTIAEKKFFFKTENGKPLSGTFFKVSNKDKLSQTLV
jgi:hypothetical protein